MLHLRSKGVLRLWVDAVCINQEDVSEKNQQILLMGSIYKRAREVISWVGVEDDDSAGALELINLLSSNSQLPIDGMATTSLESFYSLLHREYWMRMGIIQELALARVLTVHCGQWQTKWADFSQAFKAVIKVLEEQNAERSELPNLEGLFQLRFDVSESQQSRPIPFMSALRLSSRARSTNPRNKVFALLYLVDDGTTYVPAPNYRVPVEDLCREMTLSFIATKGSLDPIALLGRGCDDASVTSKQCPSWVPHWHALDGVSLRRQLAYLTGNAQPFRTSPLFRNKFRAAGDSTFLPGHDNGVLTCQSMLVGRVAVAGLSTMDADDSQLTESSDLSRLPNPYGSKKKTFWAIYCNFLCIAAAVNKYDVSGVYGNFHDRSFRQVYLPELLRI